MIRAAVQRPPESSTEASVQRDETSARIEQHASHVLGAHSHFRGRANSVSLEFREGTLIITGRLPSYYLKQLCQEALRRVDAVDRIDNRVNVICCNGLSSPPRP